MIRRPRPSPDLRERATPPGSPAASRRSLWIRSLLRRRRDALLLGRVAEHAAVVVLGDRLLADDERRHEDDRGDDHEGVAEPVGLGAHLDLVAGLVRVFGHGALLWSLALAAD